DDCLEGIYRITKSDHSRPLNLGNDYLTTINGLVDVVAKIAGKKISRRHDLSAPQGVRGRNSDNSKLRDIVGGWEPGISLEQGLKPTYEWIEQELKKA
ncbi:MAG: NAD-dependent dehydratase, partial [Acidobacteria bacterium]|nr:NAD-dependent dehydratase [Acidobacteriota bacterium]NIM63204.1 NAD-dependent dehydratase [Acidobacteriota bacterium]NIO58859.1 NAD-dependent dehydratase [Acidobacteriota bacterium]NIQ29911.1 NAD-dependent dehydratase [Acidobacteriota bacterium]NIQ84643.1 NAD-dependent dehydratase [Acidobacteriota bacterium]